MAAIDNQIRLAIDTSLLVAMLLHRRMGPHGIANEKTLRKQDRRQTTATDRPDWSTPAFLYTPKASCQALRFFTHCFHKSASQAPHEAQLQPLLVSYL